MYGCSSVCVPVFDYEGFDAIDFSLLISLLLRTQNLLGVGLHVPLRDQHFVRHRKLRKHKTGTRVTTTEHFALFTGALETEKDGSSKCTK